MRIFVDDPREHVGRKYPAFLPKESSKTIPEATWQGDNEPISARSARAGADRCRERDLCVKLLGGGDRPLTVSLSNFA